MLKIEKKIVEWIIKNKDYLFIFFLSIVGILIRYPLRKILSSDAMAYLLPWHQEILENGKIFALSQQVGDYNLLYQFLISLMTYIPINPLYQYKILSCIFDYVLAIASALLVYEVMLETDDKASGRKRGIIGYAVVLFSLVVIMNSAAWAQCDAIYSSFVILSLLFCFKGKYKLCFVMLGMAFSFKLQAVLIMPFYLFLYVYKKDFSILHFLEIPLVMVLSGLPAILVGRSVKDVFSIYFNQTVSYGQMYIKYPSFWAFLTDKPGGPDGFADFDRYKAVSLLFVMVILVSAIYLLVDIKIAMNKQLLLTIALVLTYTSVLFLPLMHERYGFIFEILSLILACVMPMTIPLAAILNIMMLYQYAGCLGEEMLPISLQGLSWINILVYGIYVFIMVKSIQRAKIKQVEISS